MLEEDYWINQENHEISTIPAIHLGNLSNSILFIFYHSPLSICIREEGYQYCKRGGG